MLDIKKKIYKNFSKKKFTLKININKKFFSEINNQTQLQQQKYSFGKKNKNKTFYVIKRSPGAGFFSNFIFVLKNLEFSIKKKLTPIVDMENFITKYNEKKNINNIKNVWELYFSNFSKYNLLDIYKSKNVVVCSNNFDVSLNDFNKLSLYQIFKSKFKINNEILFNVKKFIKKYFKNQNIVGIHIRGTDQKITPNHHLPPTIFDIISIIENKIKQNPNVKFFIVTDEKKYLDTLKKKYSSRILFFKSFRANSITDFNLSKRKYHRNKLGLESLSEAIILSYCHEIVYCKSNIPLFAIFLNNKIKIKTELYNGINSKNLFLARYKWYLTVLPLSFIRYLLFKIK